MIPLFVQSAINYTKNAIPRHYSIELEKLAHDNIFSFMTVTPTLTGAELVNFCKLFHISGIQNPSITENV